MKTIIEKDTNVSKYIFNDEDVVNITEINIVAPNMTICDLNSDNSFLVENVIPPEDWVGCKYLFVDNTFLLNPEYKETQL